MSIVSDAIAAAAAGKIPAAFGKDDPVGTVRQGTVVAANLRQCMGYEDDKPEWWDEAKTQPKQQIVVTIQTDMRDSQNPDDQGHRNIYVKWWGEQKKTLVEAVKAAGDSDVRTGGKFAVQKAGLIPSDNPKLNAAIVWAYRYQMPATGVDFNALANQQVNTGTGEVTPTAAEAAFQGLGAQQVAFTPAPAAAVPPVQQAPMGWNPAAAAGATAQPAPVAAQPVTAPAFDLEKVKQFLALGMNDIQVAAACGTDPETVAAIRNLP